MESDIDNIVMLSQYLLTVRVTGLAHREEARPHHAGKERHSFVYPSFCRVPEEYAQRRRK